MTHPAADSPEAQSGLSLPERLRLLERGLDMAAAASWEFNVRSGAIYTSKMFSKLYGPQDWSQGQRTEFSRLVHPADLERIRPFWATALRGEGPVHCEHRTQFPPENPTWVSVDLDVEHGENGALLRIFGISKDITERKQTKAMFARLLEQADRQLVRRSRVIDEINAIIGSPPIGTLEPFAPPHEFGALSFSELTDRLNHLLREVHRRDGVLEQAIAALITAQARAEAASRAKTQFVSNMSHELRTPLHAILGYAEIIEEDAGHLHHPTLQQDAGRIVHAGRHLLQLVNAVLDLDKVEAGRMEPCLQRVELPLLLQEAAETVAPLVARNNNRLMLAMCDALGALRTDRRLLFQCLLNLLSNAAKFTSDGRITVRAEREGDEVRVDVIDTGIGMTEATIARLFQPFVQADGSITREFGGSGLGLAITQRFARLLGGDVTVSSKPGAGSTFRLTVRDAATANAPQAAAVA
jgi:signal transduction histidine kinase